MPPRARAIPAIRRRRGIGRRAALLALSLLTGCSAPWLREAPAPAFVDRERLFAERRVAIAALDRFRIRGRLGLRLPEDAVAASLAWDHAPEGYSLALRGPFNRGSVQLDGDAAGVRLRADEVDARAADIDSLMREHLGWSLPVAGLPWWVRGLPAPDADYAALSLDEGGRVQHLEQSGWSLDVDQYREVDGVSLPARLRLTGGDLRLKLVIRDWGLEP